MSAQDMIAGPVVMLDKDCGVQGKLQYTKSRDKPVYTYLGVPYAEPPVGTERFKPTAPLKLWNGIRDATEFGASCPQNKDVDAQAFPRYRKITKMSEDCLFVNVYTPRPPINQESPQKRTDPLPVMVWIHGGGLFFGSSIPYDGTVLAAKHNMIVVTFNYRLNIFGFLTTPDGHFGENVGMLDQVEALKWVQTYIARFGGDPTKVTIFGESAGGHSVHLHLISPMSKGLFSRAICESGTVFYNGMAISMKRNIETLKERFAPHGVDYTSGKEIEKFLKNMDAEQITAKFYGNYRPVIGGQFLPSGVWDLHESCADNTVDLLCGFNTDEGHFLVCLLYERVRDVNFIWDKKSAAGLIEEFSKNILIPGLPQSSSICTEIVQLYLHDCGDNKESVKQAVMQMFGESIFEAPTLLLADVQSKKTNTFLYQFRHRPCFSKLPSWALSDHTDDIPYVFGEPYNLLFKDQWSEEDTYVGELMMKYWTNFAKSGDPNGPDVPKWPKYDCQTQQYLAIQHQPEIRRKYKPERMDFWNSMYKKML